MSGAPARGCNQRAAGSGHAHQARPGRHRSLARSGRAARWWERPACALDAPPIAVRAGRSRMVLASYRALIGKQSAHEARRPGLDTAARQKARVWEGARGRDSVAWGVVVAGAGAPGRLPLGSPGLPPHAPASWQGAWVSGTSSAQRRPAWRPDRSSGTTQPPWPCPWASAARNGRTRRSDTRRWPLGPPGMRRSEASS